MQGVVRTAVGQKACVRCKQCFISYNKNEQWVISRETVRVQFAVDWGMSGTEYTTGSCLQSRVLQGLTRLGAKVSCFLKSLSHFLLLR